MKEDIYKDYMARSGDDLIYTNNLVKNEHGFAAYHIADQHSLTILHVYGDGKYWDEYFLRLAKEKGLKRILFATRRNYKAFERRYGYKKIGYVLEKEV